jgi:hypothetical protein
LSSLNIDREPVAHRHRARLVVAAALVLGLALTSLPHADAAPGTRSMQDAKGDLAAQEAKLERLDAQRSRAEGTVVELGQERRNLELRVQRLGVEAEDYHRQLQEARRDARLATVEAYVSGNRRTAAVDAGGSADALWQETIVSDRADAGVEAAVRYDELRARAEEDVVRLADETDQVEARILQAETDVDRAVRSMAVTRQGIADIREEIKILEIVARYGGGRPDASESGWAALRNCESHGNYATNTGNGFYGAYQFDLQTWRSMGGSGLPSDAPPWEQDARAKALYQTRGSQPWPVCGRFL